MRKIVVLSSTDKGYEYEFFYTIESDTCTTAVLSEGDFSIIYPGEAHAPGIRHCEEKKNVRKIVFKIKY